MNLTRSRFNVERSTFQRTALALRVNRQNPDHHLWLNNGTWFVHYTVCPTPFTAERVRRSLGTKDVEEARRRRDELLGLRG